MVNTSPIVVLPEITLSIEHQNVVLGKKRKIVFHFETHEAIVRKNTIQNSRYTEKSIHKYIHTLFKNTWIITFFCRRSLMTARKSLRQKISI